MLLVIGNGKILSSKDMITIIDTDDFITENVYFGDIESLVLNGKLHIENIDIMTNLSIKNRFYVRPYRMLEGGINTFGDELIVVNDYKLLIWYNGTLFYTYDQSFRFILSFGNSSYVYRIGKGKWRIIVKGVERSLCITITRNSLVTSFKDEILFFQESVSRADITKKLLLGDSIV